MLLPSLVPRLCSERGDEMPKVEALLSRQRYPVVTARSQATAAAAAALCASLHRQLAPGALFLCVAARTPEDLGSRLWQRCKMRGKENGNIPRAKGRSGCGMRSGHFGGVVVGVACARFCIFLSLKHLRNVLSKVIKVYVQQLTTIIRLLFHSDKLNHNIGAECKGAAGACAETTIEPQARNFIP